MTASISNVVLVTGAASGIGRSCALYLARLGHTVYATTRRDASQLLHDLRASAGPAGRIEAVAMDVNDAASVHAAVRDVADRAGRIDALVHCAGFGIAGPIEETADDEAMAIFQTNLFGTLRVCREVLSVMRGQGAGTIVNFSSIGGRIAVPYQGLYSATKFAVEGLTEAMRMEVKRFGVHAVLVEPGDFCTGFTDKRVRVRGATASSPYAAPFERALRVAEHDERNGQKPDPIARLVGRILASRSPRARYTIGPPAQRLAVCLKSLLPSRWFEKALAAYYRVN